MPKTLEQMSLAELGDELNNVVTESRNILNIAEKEGRTKETLLPAEEERIIALTSQIGPIKEAQGKKQTFLSKLTELDGVNLDAKNRRVSPRQSFTKEEIEEIVWKNSAAMHLPRSYRKTSTYGTDEYAAAFSAYLRGSAPRMASEGMSVSDDERGGYFVTSEAFSTEVVKNVDDAVHVQAMSRVFMLPPGAKNYNIRTRKAKASTFAFSGAENRSLEGRHDTSLKYGKRVMTPNWMDGSCIISRELIRNFPGAEAMVLQELVLDASETLEQAYLYGTGNMEPVGLLTPSDDGIDSSRDQSTVDANAFNFDDFTRMKYSLKPKYRRSAVWMFHRLILQEVALLKDGEGQYLWQPSRVAGQPDQILGINFVESEWMPSTVVTGNYYAILGDFSWYYIMWDMEMQMQRLQEMKAYTNEFEYLFRAKVDAQPILAEAFSRGLVS